MYCRIHRVFQDLQNRSCSDGGVASSTKQQLLWRYAICLFAAKIAEKLNYFSRISQKGLNMDLLSKVRLQLHYIGCTLIWIYQKQLNMANSTSSRAGGSNESRGSLDIFFLWHIHIGKLQRCSLIISSIFI